VGQNLEFSATSVRALREASSSPASGPVLRREGPVGPRADGPGRVAAPALHSPPGESRLRPPVPLHAVVSSSTLWNASRVRLGRPQHSPGRRPQDVPRARSSASGRPCSRKIGGRDPGEADRLDVRVGRVIERSRTSDADSCTGSRRIGDEVRTLVAGMKANYTKEEMLGKCVAGPCNLEPAEAPERPLNGMVLRGGGRAGRRPPHPPEDAPSRAGPRSPRGPRLPFSEFQSQIRVAEGDRVVILGTTGRWRCAEAEEKPSSSTRASAGTPVHTKFRISFQPPPTPRPQWRRTSPEFAKTN